MKTGMKRRTIGIMLVCLISVLASCAAYQKPIDPLKAVKSTSQPYQNQITHLDKYIEGLAENFNIPGMVFGIIEDGQVIYRNNYGAINDTGYNLDTRFLWGSNTKSMTVTMILALVQEGIVSLDDPLKTYLPEFRFADKEVAGQATIRDALSMRIGLPDQAGLIPLFVTGTHYHDMISYLETLEPAYPFRQGWAYSNLSINLASVAAEKATGKSYQTLMEEYVFSPLGMDNAGTDAENFIEAENYASPYSLTVPMPTPFDVSNTAPAGSVSGTVTDIEKYLIFHMNQGSIDGNSYISNDILAQAHTPQSVEAEDFSIYSPSESKAKYGLGFMIYDNHYGSDTVAHAGALPGATSFIAFKPDEKIGFYAAINSYPFVDLLFALNDEFFATMKGQESMHLSQYLSNIEFEAYEPDTYAVENNSSYTGTYIHPVLGIIEISQDQDGLEYYLPKNKTRGDLIPAEEQENAFYIRCYNNPGVDLLSYATGSYIQFNSQKTAIILSGTTGRFIKT